ncbi:MAG: PAS domain S-box protein [Bacteroidota bacterium]
MSPEPFEQRSVIEQALASVSHMLVSSGEADLRDVLRILGEALGAECAYLVTIPDESGALDGAKAPLGTMTRWHRDGASSEQSLFGGDIDSASPTLRLLANAQPHAVRDQPVHAGTEGREPAGVAIPLLSKQDRFVGYLGIEHAALPSEALREHGRVLSVFGDLLAGYLSRRDAERALQESEERWRKFVEFNPEPILVTAAGNILYANEACARLLGIDDLRALQNYALRDFLPADQIDLMDLQQVEGSTRTPLEHEIVRLDGTERTVETVAVAVRFHGLEAVQMVMRDITDRKRSEERYRTFVQTISEGVWRIDIAKPVPALAFPALQAEQILQHGYLAECNTMMTRLLGATRTEAVVGKPVRLLVPALGSKLLEAFVEDGYRLYNYELSVPAAGQATRHFSLNAVGRIERGALVRIWGSCVEVSARVEMERRMVAVLEEQQERIGRDLHDSVGQLLTGIRMLSENLGHRYFAPDDDGFAATRKVTAFAEDALQRVREICRGLVPPQLYQEGIGSALQGLCATMDAISDARCSFTHHGGADVVDYETQLQLYRIAQEAVNNALKHAEPEHVWIRLTREDDTVTLEVEDDGQGFDEERKTRRSLGLYSMKRRASSIRAALTIDSELEVGTLVRVELPAETAPVA